MDKLRDGKRWKEGTRAKWNKSKSPDAFKVPRHSKYTETYMAVIIPSNLLRCERV